MQAQMFKDAKAASQAVTKKRGKREEQKEKPDAAKKPVK